MEAGAMEHGDYTTGSSNTASGYGSPPFLFVVRPGGTVVMERPAVQIFGARVRCDACGCSTGTLFARNTEAPGPSVAVCMPCAEVTW